MSPITFFASLPRLYSSGIRRANAGPWHQKLRVVSDDATARFDRQHPDAPCVHLARRIAYDDGSGRWLPWASIIHIDRHTRHVDERTAELLFNYDVGEDAHEATLAQDVF